MNITGESQAARRAELRRWYAGDSSVPGPATGLSPAYLPISDRTVTMRISIPRPEGGNGRIPYAGKDGDERE